MTKGGDRIGTQRAVLDFPLFQFRFTFLSFYWFSYSDLGHEMFCKFVLRPFIISFANVCTFFFFFYLTECMCRVKGKLAFLNTQIINAMHFLNQWRNYVRYWHSKTASFNLFCLDTWNESNRIHYTTTVKPVKRKLSITEYGLNWKHSMVLIRGITGMISKVETCLLRIFFQCIVDSCMGSGNSILS